MKNGRAIAYLVSVLAVVLEVRGKSLLFNKYNTGPRYEARKQALDFDYDDPQDNDHLENIYSYKRSVEDVVHPYKRSIFGGMRKRSPYGLVYNQGKPIGILEPIGQAFEYASYPAPREVGFRNTGFKSQWYPAKRELALPEFDELSEQDREDIEGQTTPLHSSNYANVLAKFKVNNKVKQRPYQDFMYAQQVKRDVEQGTTTRGGAVDGASCAASSASTSGASLSYANAALSEPSSRTTSLLDDSASSSGGDEETANKKKESMKEEMKKRGALDLGDLVCEQQRSQPQEVKIDSAAQKPVATKTKRKTEEKLDQIEENLKGVMDDMSLVEKETADSQKEDDPSAAPSNSGAAVKKREIYFEDEDLENGLNKIGLTKESHYDRNKKEDCPGKTKIVTKSLKNVKKTKVEKSIHKKGKKKSKKESDEAKQRIVKSPKRMRSGGEVYKAARVANYQVEGEEFIRRKRQAVKEVEKDDSSDIMKGLEVSGDLTVSGNKSPLVAVSNDESEKKSQEKRDKEELEYERRLERNIEAKINAIKEEVKREISRLQGDDECKVDTQRKKREVSFSNLMDEESSILDPGINIEGVLEPHIRRRRDADLDSDKRILGDNVKFHQDGGSDEESSLSGKVGGDQATKGLDDNRATGTSKIEDDNSVNKNDDGGQLTSKVEEEKTDDDSAKVSKSSDSSLDAPSDDDAFALNKRQQPTNEESESEQKDKPLEKRELSGPSSRSSSSSTSSDSSGDTGDDDSKDSSGSDDDEDSALMKRNEKKEKERVSKMQDDGKEEGDKNVDKREVKIAATDKVETDIKGEVGTDAPSGVVKRDEDSVDLTEKERADIDAVISDANNIVKRNEDTMTTEKFVIPREGVEPMGLMDAGAGDERREERSVENKPKDVSAEQTLLKDADDESAKRPVKDLKPVDDANDREQRSTEQSSNKPIAAKNVASINEKLHKRSTGDSQVTIEELGKPAPSKSIILNEQDMDKETGIEERSAKEPDVAKDSNAGASLSMSPDQKTERTDQKLIDSESGQVDREDQDENEVYRNARKSTNVVEEDTPNLEMLNLDHEELEVARRRRRSLYGELMRRNARRKRDGAWNYRRNQDVVGYHADDGEIDDEDDEMQDDGFDDQTANMMVNKRHVADYETSDDQDSQDYPTYIERNKRNALRLYDDETDADESFDNFLFYPNRYFRHKRHNNFGEEGGGDGGGGGGGGGGLAAAAAAARAQRMRRKRLEQQQQQQQRMRGVAATAAVDKSDMASLSEADIFGGLPQSYEGELSRFKRVKRSRDANGAD